MDVADIKIGILYISDSLKATSTLIQLPNSPSGQNGETAPTTRQLDHIQEFYLHRHNRRIMTINVETNEGGSGSTNTDTGAGIENLDVLIIGAGFTGCYLLPKLREVGFTVKVVDQAPDVGGVWYWNRYPGARVDSQYPVYSLSRPEVWKTWNWSEKYPSWKELQGYFHRAADQLELRKDMIFGTTVVAATFNEDSNKWPATSDNGEAVVRILCDSRRWICC